MSARKGFRGLFVEPRRASGTSAGRRAGAPRRATGALPSPQGRSQAWPTVVVLAAPEHVTPATAAFALALARVCGTPCALAAVAGAAGPMGATSLVPSARRAAGRVRREGHAATPAGRVVWLADDRAVGAAIADPPDPAGIVAAVSARLGRATATAAAPAALGVALARTPGLDRVLAWHDAVAVVRDPHPGADLDDLVVSSLAALGRPVAVVTPLARVGGAAAIAGLRAPALVQRAVGDLGLSSVRA